MALRQAFVALALVITVRLFSFTVFPQERPDAARVREMTVPHFIAFNGVLRDRNGQPMTGVVGVTLSLYKDQVGGVPLWTENQNVSLDAQGHYSLLLGATQGDGLRMELFTTGESRWLGVQPQIADQEEQPRVLLVSVPYALKSSDADTLGGKPAAAYVLSSNGTSSKATDSVVGNSSNQPTVSAVSGTGVAGTLTKWMDANGTLGDSVVHEQNGNVGIGTTGPNAPLEVVGANELLRLNGTNNTMLSLLSSGSGRKNRGFLLDQFGKLQIYNLADGLPELVIDTSHHVGIGTANPAAPFHIFSTGATFAHVEGTSAGIDVGWLIRNNAPSGRQWAIRSTGDGRLLFRDDSAVAERFVVDSTGNIGVGVASPSSRLDVAGTVNVSGNVNLPNTTNSSGALMQGGARFLHSFGTNNTYLGKASGNFTVSGQGNTGIGSQALQSITTGSYNTGIGSGALLANISGTYNTAVGTSALITNTTGDANTAAGLNALLSNTTGRENTAVGSQALEGNVSGSDNTAMGSRALTGNTTGQGNTALGDRSLFANIGGWSNTAVGASSLFQNTATANTALGNGALSGNTTGSNNTAVGLGAGNYYPYSNATGSNNTFIGVSAGPGTSNELNNSTAIGANAVVAASNALVLGDSAVSVGIGTSIPTAKLDVVGTVKATTFVGNGSGLTNIPGGTASNVDCATPCISAPEIVTGTITDAQVSNSAAISPTKISGTSAVLGANTFNATQTIASGNLRLPATTNALTGVLMIGGVPFLHGFGSVNTFVGGNAGNTAMLGNYNTAVGDHALGNNTSGSSNTATGAHSLASNMDGFANTATGNQTLEHNTTGYGDTALGAFALQNNTSGYWNTAQGYYALSNNGTGSHNTANGADALTSNSSGSSNTADGSMALVLNTNGSSNVAIGDSALKNNTGGYNNTAVGSLSGVTATAGNSNILGTNNTFIGYQSGPGSSTQLMNATAIGANALVSASDSLVLGDGTVNVGIGTSIPTAKLDVNGGLRLYTVAAKPICDASSRGTFWFTQGATGVKDLAEVCAKDASDSFAWRTIY